MNLLAFLKPKPTISDRDMNSGVRWLNLEGLVSNALFSIIGSGLLVAFALALGANNLQVGILAALPSLMQVVQLPATWLVERFRRRKAIAVIAFFLAQMVWFPIALIPFFIETPSGGAISLLLILMACRFLFGAITGCSQNSWIRDLIPQEKLGRVFAKRQIFITVGAIIFSLGTALFVDFWQSRVTGQSLILGYTYVILFGVLFLGMTSVVFMAMMPEPLMQPVIGTRPSIIKKLVAPFRDRNFRQLLLFQLLCGFTSNMVGPFFTVYMLKSLGLPLSWVIGLSILSQLFSILFLRVWGRFVDRFGSKVVLSLGLSLWLLFILGWMFITMPEHPMLIIPFLIIFHSLAGIAGAALAMGGVIAWKLSPQGEATSYLAGVSLVGSIGAGVGPLCGGLLADFFGTRQLALTFTWTSLLNYLQVPALRITGFGFLLGIAFILGLITLSILARIREEGEVSREVVLESLTFPTREISRPVSPVPAYNPLSRFPFSYIIRYMKRIPVPGLDVAVGVTAYQIAETARAAASAAVRGRKVTKKLVSALQDELAMFWKVKTEAKEHDIAITREAARGAMHVVDDKPLAVENLAVSVATSVVKASSKAGVNPLDGIQGATQGIIRGAIETGADVTAATRQAIQAAKEVARQTGISEDSAIAKATVGAVEVAQAAGPQVVESVKKALRTTEYDGKEK